MKNSWITMQKLDIAISLLKIIIQMVNQEEDYSLIMREYNDLIEEYELPLFKIKWISSTEFEFIKNKNKEEEK